MLVKHPEALFFKQSKKVLLFSVMFDIYCSLISVAFYKRYRRNSSVILLLTCRKANTNSSKWKKQKRKEKTASGKDIMLKMAMI